MKIIFRKFRLPEDEILTLPFLAEVPFVQVIGFSRNVIVDKKIPLWDKQQLQFGWILT